MASFVHLLKEGKPYSWLVLGLFVVGLVTFVTLAIQQHRKLARPSWPLWIAPLVVVLAGFGGMGLLVRKFDNIVLDRPDALGMRAVLFGQGRSEALSVAIVGSLASALLLSLSGIAASARALRQGHREVTGRAYAAGVVGLLLSIGALFIRKVLLVKMGMQASFMSLPAGLVLGASVVASLCIFLAAGSIPEWVDEEDEKAAVGDVATALSLAVASVVLTLVGAQLLHWQTIFGATAAASVDPVERGGILQTGNDGARALVIAGLVALAPILIAVVIAILPRVKAVGRGALKAAPAITAALIATLLSSIVTNVTTQRSIARLHEIDELAWPKDVEAVFVDQRTSGLGPVLGTTLFVKNDRVWFENRLKKVTLTDPQACDDVVQLAPVAAIRDTPLAIGVDKTTPIAAMHCLALAAAERRWAMLEKGAKASNDEVAWLVRIRVDRGRGASDQYTSRTRAMGATAQSELSAAAAHVHITRTGWELQRRGAPVERGEGNGLPQVALPESSLVLVTTSPDVTAERFLTMVGAMPSNAHLLLGPPSLGIDDDGDDSPVSLKAVPRTGFGSEIIWQSSTALAQADADVIESKVQEAIGKCASTAGAATLNLSFTIDKGGQTSIIPTPADTRGSCFADALGMLHLGPRDVVSTANIILGELHLSHLQAGIAKRTPYKPTPPPKRPPPPPKKPPPPPPPRKK